MKRVFSYLYLCIVIYTIVNLASCTKKPEFKDIELTPRLIECINSYDTDSKSYIGVNEYVFSEGLLKVKKDDKYGFINANGEEVVPCIYEDAQNFSEGLSRIKKNGKYGFINSKGEEVIPCKIHFASSFSEGLSLIKKKNGKYGFINPKGKVAIPCIYDGASDFSEGLAIIETNGKYGYINTKGKEVTPCTYDYAHDFSEGLAIVRNRAGKYGFIDANGKEIIPFIYDNAQNFSEGLAFVKKDSQWRLINPKGEEIFLHINFPHGNFSEGFATVMKDGNYGFINPSGEEVIPCIFDMTDSFYEGLAIVREAFGKYGFINHKGETVIPCKYDLVSHFSEGVAPVIKDGFIGFVDKNGNDTFNGTLYNKKEQLKKEKEERQAEMERKWREEQRKRLEEEKGPDWINGTWRYNGYISTPWGESLRVNSTIVINRDNQTLVAVENDRVVENGSYSIHDGAIHCGDTYFNLDKYNERIELGYGKYYSKVNDNVNYSEESSRSRNNNSYLKSIRFNTGSDVYRFTDNKFVNGRESIRIRYDAVIVNGSAITGAPRIINITPTTAVLAANSPYAGGQEYIFYISVTSGTIGLPNGEKFYLKE